MTKIAVIGAGYWGPNLIRNVTGNSLAELTGICDTNSDVIKRLKAEYPQISFFKDLDEMIDKSGPEALIVATPTSLHYEHARRALQKGLHVLIEKPATQTANQMIKLVKFAAETGKVLMVGHTFLYNNIVREVKDRIDAGELGEIQYVYSHRLNLGRFRRDSDVLWTLAPHDISILNFWFEDLPVQVSARGLPYIHAAEEIAEVCFALMEYPGNRCAHLHMSWLDPQKVRRMVVVGSKKMLVYDDTDTNKHIQIYDKGVEKKHRRVTKDFSEFTTILRTGDLTIPNIRLIEPLSVEIKHFIDCIQSARRPLTDGRHGIEVITILEALTESMRRNGCPVPVTYPPIIFSKDKK